MLVERQLISRELSEASGIRSVYIDPQEQFSFMVNEEDHLRMQVMHSGLDMDSAWEQMSRMDDLLAEADSKVAKRTGGVAELADVASEAKRDARNLEMSDAANEVALVFLRQCREPAPQFRRGARDRERAEVRNVAIVEQADTHARALVGQGKVAAV